MVDYMAMECLPLMVNDEMVFPYANVLEWPKFSLHMRKREIPQIAERLRAIPEAAQRAMPPPAPTAASSSPSAARLARSTPRTPADAPPPPTTTTTTRSARRPTDRVRPTASDRPSDRPRSYI